jgi:hypothetical protein
MPALHFDVKPMTARPKFIVRHSTSQSSFTLDFSCQIVVMLKTFASFPSNFHIIMLLERFDVFNFKY